MFNQKISVQSLRTFIVVGLIALVVAASLYTMAICFIANIFGADVTFSQMFAVGFAITLVKHVKWNKAKK